jgi:hypothetical protein
LNERKTKIVYEEADDTLNDSERSSERLKETKKAGVMTDAFLKGAPWRVIVTDISRVLVAERWPSQGGVGYLKQGALMDIRLTR